MEWAWDFPNIFWPFFGVWALIALAILAFDVWMLIDAIQRPASDFSSSDAKTWWIVGLVVGLITGLPAIAVALAYYLIVRRPAVEGRGEAHAGAAGYPPAPGPPATTPPAGTPPPPPRSTPPPPSRPVAAGTNCRNCGAKLVAGARFCHSCGQPAAAL